MTKVALIAKTEVAVKDRLTKEITYWDHRAEQLKLQEQAGKTGARLNSGEARKRADACCKHVSRNGLRNSGSRRKSRRCPRWCWEDYWSSPRGSSMP